MRAVVFPGQGAQRKGMGVELFERYPRLVEQADALLGFSLHALCTDGADKLIDTRYTQPALFMVSYLGYLDHEHRFGAPAMLAGHSIGEFAALAASGVLDFTDALRLVDVRARIMSTIRDGAMAAVIGPDSAGVARLIASTGCDGLEIANENSPTQTIVAGLTGEIDTFVERCREAGTRAVRLRVSGAFHSRHMKPAAASFAQALRDVRFNAPRIPVVANVTARAHDASLPDVMAAHLYSPVRWMQSVHTMLDAGVGEFVEIGPAPVLGPMIEEIRTAHRVRPQSAPAALAAWPEFAPPPVPLNSADSMLVRDLFAAYHAPTLNAAHWLALWQRGRDAMRARGAHWPALTLASGPRALRRQVRAALETLVAAAGAGAPQAPQDPTSFQPHPHG
jgi:malonyl CoA-acyl carrier protein transacylase